MLDHCEMTDLPVDQEILSSGWVSSKHYQSSLLQSPRVILMAPVIPDTQRQERAHEHLFMEDDLGAFCRPKRHRSADVEPAFKCSGTPPKRVTSVSLRRMSYIPCFFSASLIFA